MPLPSQLHQRGLLVAILLDVLVELPQQVKELGVRGILCVPLHKLPTCVLAQFGQGNFCVAVVVLEHHVVALGNDALVVVVADPSAHGVVVHVRFVLGLAPEMSHIFVVKDSKLGNIAVDPSDLVVVFLIGEELKEEAPQLRVHYKRIKGGGSGRMRQAPGEGCRQGLLHLIGANLAVDTL